MKIIHSIQELRDIRRAIPHEASLGFVPTMGNLHEGHLKLVERSLHDNQRTCVSLFVNRAQFNNASDFENYPVTLAEDVAALEALGVDYCFIPDDEEMYSDGFIYQVHETKNSFILEGEHRPGHFTGVLTVVMKLFMLTKPTRAYFGEKDYQQLSLIQGMIDAFFLDIELIACPTIRNAGNLALSSRNNRLSSHGLELAELFANIFRNASSAEAASIALQNAGIVVEYVKDYNNRRFAAVLVEGIRLIDNYKLPPHGAFA